MVRISRRDLLRGTSLDDVCDVTHASESPSILEQVARTAGRIAVPILSFAGAKAYADAIAHQILVDQLTEAYESLQGYEGFTMGDRAIIIDGKTQILRLVEYDAENGHLVPLKAFPLSTGKAGFGMVKGSGKTPTGVFQCNERYTDHSQVGEPHHRIRKSYIDPDPATIYPIWKPHREKAFMTTRVMYLHGLDEANQYTCSRGIAIHGTQLEYTIGKPRSDGCIRMRNDDIIVLYDMIAPAERQRANTFVIIFKDIAEGK